MMMAAKGIKASTPVQATNLSDFPLNRRDRYITFQAWPKTKSVAVWLNVGSEQRHPHGEDCQSRVDFLGAE